MTSELSLLQQAGIELVSPLSAPMAHAKLFKVAQRIRDKELHRVGLIVVGKKASASNAALQLSFPLADVTEGRVAVVDGRRGQPAFSALAAAQFVEEVDEGFWSVPLSPSVELFTRVTPIDSVESLLRFMAKIAPNHPHALVDLSGYEEHGTHLRAYDAVDGVLVIAVAGVDKEKALLAKVEPIPEDKRLGVLLATR